MTIDVGSPLHIRALFVAYGDVHDGDGAAPVDHTQSELGDTTELPLHNRDVVSLSATAPDGLSILINSNLCVMF